ncbi:MAG: PDZ domain-containing protein [Candidatus Eisenbacteria bacterium]|nr:PDZ domain-containing protein [Candidatus Eisenbacteria bacterium]
MNSPTRFHPIRALLSALPLLALLAYGLLVSSPEGRAARGRGMVVRPDARVELAALLARAGGDLNAAWPSAEPKRVDANGLPLPATGIGAGRAETHIGRLSGHPAARRISANRSKGLTSEVLTTILLNRSGWPELERLKSPMDEVALARLPGGPTFLGQKGIFTSGFLDSLIDESRDFALVSGFDSIFAAAEPPLRARSESIEKDPTLSHLTARLADFFGEPSHYEPIVIPTHYGPWRAPFAVPVEDGRRILVIERAESAGKLTPETSLSWICVREFSRPTVERLTRANAERVSSLAGYWSYLKQGVAATTVGTWEDCFNAHLYRAIDLRVRLQADGVERELRIASALQAGLGMIRALDASMLGYDRGRDFYRRFTDYYPTMLEEMAGLEARVRVERPRLGIKVVSTGSGLRVDDILKGHSADGSALRVGDVITEVDGRPVLSEDRLAEIVQSHRIGSTLPFVVERGGVSQEIDLILTRGRIEYEFFQPTAPLTATPPDSSAPDSQRGATPGRSTPGAAPVNPPPSNRIPTGGSGL